MAKETIKEVLKAKRALASDEIRNTKEQLEQFEKALENLKTVKTLAEGKVLQLDDLLAHYDPPEDQSK